MKLNKKTIILGIIILLFVILFAYRKNISEFFNQNNNENSLDKCDSKINLKIKYKLNSEKSILNIDSLEIKSDDEVILFEDAKIYNTSSSLFIEKMKDLGYENCIESDYNLESVYFKSQLIQNNEWMAALKKNDDSKSIEIKIFSNKQNCSDRIFLNNDKLEKSTRVIKLMSEDYFLVQKKRYANSSNNKVNDSTIDTGDDRSFRNHLIKEFIGDFLYNRNDELLNFSEVFSNNLAVNDDNVNISIIFEDENNTDINEYELYNKDLNGIKLKLRFKFNDNDKTYFLKKSNIDGELTELHFDYVSNGNTLKNNINCNRGAISNTRKIFMYNHNQEKKLFVSLDFIKNFNKSDNIDKDYFIFRFFSNNGDEMCVKHLDTNYKCKKEAKNTFLYPEFKLKIIDKLVFNHKPFYKLLFPCKDENSVNYESIELFNSNENLESEINTLNMKFEEIYKNLERIDNLISSYNLGSQDNLRLNIEGEKNNINGLNTDIGTILKNNKLRNYFIKIIDNEIQGKTLSNLFKECLKKKEYVCEENVGIFNFVNLNNIITKSDNLLQLLSSSEYGPEILKTDDINRVEFIAYITSLKTNIESIKKDICIINKVEYDKLNNCNQIYEEVSATLGTFNGNQTVSTTGNSSKNQMKADCPVGSDGCPSGSNTQVSSETNTSENTLENSSKNQMKADCPVGSDGCPSGSNTQVSSETNTSENTLENSYKNQMKSDCPVGSDGCPSGSNAQVSSETNTSENTLENSYKNQMKADCPVGSDGCPSVSNPQVNLANNTSAGVFNSSDDVNNYCPTGSENCPSTSDVGRTQIITGFNTQALRSNIMNILKILLNINTDTISFNENQNYFELSLHNTNVTPQILNLKREMIENNLMDLFVEALKEYNISKDSIKVYVFHTNKKIILEILAQQQQQNNAVNGRHMDYTSGDMREYNEFMRIFSQPGGSGNVVQFEPDGVSSIFAPYIQIQY
uniref:Uncharacterized protein n=1 Tax=Mimiviridae sp. ChoanoV1 TaxID=2596887 RepID=A0A5B8IGV8_9VIRU|nr:hypothetical protein 1_50 [Mimiviridae sp. ChoanoV1]